jgi:hypothetical protein
VSVLSGKYDCKNVETDLLAVDDIFLSKGIPVCIYSITSKPGFYLSILSKWFVVNEIKFQ